MKKILTLFAVATCLGLCSSAAQASIVTINTLTVTSGGVFGHAANTSAVTINGAAPAVATADPIDIKLTYSNLDLDGDASANDAVTFTIRAAGGGAGQRIFDQGIDTGFGNLTNVTTSVIGVSGTTTDLGNAIVFDGFTGANAGMGANGVFTRNVDVNGTTVNLATTGGGFQFVQGTVTFAPTASVLFTNSGGTGGSIVARAYNLQFSTVAVPEPTSFSLFGLGVLGLVARRRRR